MKFEKSRFLYDFTWILHIHNAPIYATDFTVRQKSTHICPKKLALSPVILWLHTDRVKL